MYEKWKKLFVLSLLAIAPSVVGAEEQRWLGEGPWYGSVRFGLLSDVSSDGRFVGPTESVYGGTPLIEMDDGSQVSFVFGREFLDNWRLGFELSYLASESESSPMLGMELRSDDVFNLQADVDSLIFMANLGYDFDNLNWWAKPYLRGGIGVASTDVNATLSVEYNSSIWSGTVYEGQTVTNHVFPEGNSSEFTWNVAAGFKKKLAERFDLRLEYSHLNRGEAWSGVDEGDDFVSFSDIESQQITLGVDYRFD